MRQSSFSKKDRAAEAQSRHTWWHRKGQMSHFLRLELKSSKMGCSPSKLKDGTSPTDSLHTEGCRPNQDTDKALSGSSLN